MASTIPEGGFTEIDQLQIWFYSLPKGQHIVVARSLASRSALRVLPLASRRQGPIGMELSLDERWHLAGIRANNTSNIGLKNHSIFAEDNFVIAANLSANVAQMTKQKFLHNRISDGATKKFATNSINNAAANAVRAFLTMTSAIEISLSSVKYSVAAVQTHYTVLTGFIYANAFWAAVTADARALEAGTTPDQMATRPLWPADSPDKPAFDRKSFLAAAPSFDVWLDWYEPIAEGKAPWGLPRDVADALEMRIALGDHSEDGGKAFWEREPDKVNAQIKSWVDAARAEVASKNQDTFEIAQDSTAAIMVATEQGQIDRAPIPVSQRLHDTPEQQKEYANCRDELLLLIEYGPNQLGRLSPQLKAMLAAMPMVLGSTNTIDFWRAMNRLRRTYNSHLNATDPLPGDNSNLNPDVAEDLGALVDLLNVFSSFDPSLRERDYRRIAPQDRPAIFEEHMLGAPVIEAILNTENLLTAQAQDEVTNSNSNAVDAIATEHGSQALDQHNKTTRNVFGALINVARNGLMRIKNVSTGEIGYFWREYRGGAYKAAGAGSIAAIGSDLSGLTQFHITALKFVAENWSVLNAYATQVFANPRITELFEFIAKLFT